MAKMIVKSVTSGALPLWANTLQWVTISDWPRTLPLWCERCSMKAPWGVGGDCISEEVDNVVKYPGNIHDSIIGLQFFWWILSVDPPSKGHNDKEQTVLTPIRQLSPISSNSILPCKWPVPSILPLWLGCWPPLDPLVLEILDGINDWNVFHPELLTMLEPPCKLIRA